MIEKMGKPIGVGVVGVGDRLGYVALAHEPRLTLVVRGEPQVERFVVRVGDLYERHPPGRLGFPEETGAAPGVEERWKRLSSKTKLPLLARGALCTGVQRYQHC